MTSVLASMSAWLCWTRVDVAPMRICPPLCPMTAWISAAAVSPTSKRMTVSRVVVPTRWEAMKRIWDRAAAERPFIAPIPLTGDSMRAWGSLATPWYLTDHCETRGSWLDHLARRGSCLPSRRGTTWPWTRLMSASPESLAVAAPAVVLGPSVGVTPR